jgi:serine/threonine-protein kinase TTK/MPS1
MQTKIIADTLSKLETGAIAYKDVDQTLWANKQFVLAAIKQNFDAILLANASLQKDREILLEAAKKAWCLEYHNEDSLEAAERKWYLLEILFDANIKKDKEFMLEVLKEDGNALKCADASLQEDREIVLAAVKRRWQWRVFEYAADSLKKDREFILEVVKQNYHIIDAIDDSLKEDKDFLLEAMKLEPNIYYHTDAAERL